MSGAPQQSPVPQAQRLQAVLARLALSRSALRQEMLPTPDRPGPATADGSPGSAPLLRLWQSLGRFSRRWPVTTVLVDAARHWWDKHPWRTTGELVAYGAASQLQSLVRRHPAATVAGAALLGGLLMGLRPWRWQLVGKQLGPVPGHVGQWLIAQLASAPMQAALASLVLMALRPAASAATHTTGQSTDDLPPQPAPSIDAGNGVAGLGAASTSPR